MKKLITDGGIPSFTLKLDLKMKLTTFLLLISLISMGANNYAQSTKISLALENVTIEKVLNEIENSTDFKFFFSREDVDVNRIVSVETDGETIEIILDEVFSDSPIYYEVYDKQILLKEKDEIETPINTPKEDPKEDPIQLKQISGVVTDAEDGSTIPGVQVIVKGTTHGTTTDIDGKYSFTLPESALILQFTYIGMEAQEVVIGNQSVINVKMSMSTTSLDEIVVVGYGIQKKRDVTGAISKVKGDDLKMVPVQSFDQALQGKAAGVMITMPNGVLNNAPVIRVRGFNSISSSSYPLIVVDGVPVFTGDVSTNSTANNPLSDINPSDIQSMEVLKDASATAIYGSRAASGVILITTKRGKTGKTKVSYDGSFGYTEPFNVFDVMNAEQYVEHKNKAAENNPGSLKFPFFIPTINGEPVDTDWADIVYRKGFQHSHAINFSGATPSTTYYLSVGYTDQEGMITNNTYSRKNARLNLEHKLNKYVNLSANIAITNSFNKAPNTGSLEGQSFASSGAARWAFMLPSNIGPYNEDGSWSLRGASIGSMGQPTNFGPRNPVAVFALNSHTSENDRLLANFSATFEPVKNLIFKTSYGIDNLAVENITFQSGITGDGYNSNGYASNYYNRLKRWTWTNTVNYSYTLKEKTNFSILAGTEEQYTQANGWGASKTDVTDPFFTSYQGSWITAGMGTGTQYENYFISTFSRLTANYDQKYYFEASLRRDGFSGLATGNKYGLFGGASLMWNLANEGFVKDGKLGEIFSDLRLKTSYGQVGNMSGIGSYQSLFLYTSGVYGSSPTWMFDQAGNPDLRWETSDKYDIGLSFGLLKDKIQVDMNYYYNDVNDLILNVPQTPSKGIPGNTVPMNIGAMYNRGFEFSVTSYNVAKKDFTWTTNFNISTLKNEVTELAPGVTEIVGVTKVETTNRTMVGSPVGNIFGVETRGVDPETGRRVFVNAAGKEVLYYFENSSATRWQYRDGSGVAPAISLNADGKILGSPLPTVFGGMDNAITYKDFDFALNITYALGFEIYNGSKAGMRDQRWWNNSVEVYETAWEKPGDITNIPKPIYGDPISNGSRMVLSENVEKGNYLKVRNITLGYTLKDLQSKYGIEKVRFYASVFNAFVLTGYTGSDPEVSTNGNNNLTPGVDRNSAPQARTFSFGVNVVF